MYSSTRVAPTKSKLSVPKKELNGVVHGCLNAVDIANALGISKERIFIHTDSLVTLHWISKDKNTLKMYVSNRVHKIQETKLKVLFTPGTENPADLCSKPKPARDYVNNAFWMSGPKYLEEPNEKWEKKYSLETIANNQLTEDEEASIHKELKTTTTAKMNNLKIEIEPP